MRKHKIIATRPLQILGHEGTVEPGTLLATIETDCEIGSLLSSLQFDNARVETEADEASGESDPLRDAIVDLINVETDPPLTNKQIVEALAAKDIKTTVAKVSAVRKSLQS